MPRKRRTGKVRTTGLNRLNDARRFYLRSGICLSGLEDELGFPEDDLLSAKVLFLTNEKEIMEMNVDRKNPGRRPWGWWLAYHKEMLHENHQVRYKFLKEHELLEKWEVIAHDEFNKMAQITED